MPPLQQVVVVSKLGIIQLVCYFKIIFIIVLTILLYFTLILSDLEIPLSSAPPIVVPNGSVLTEGSSSKPTGAIPKSISFDKTAERGDKVSIFWLISC